MIELEVAAADVTKLEVDASTNAANTQLKHPLRERWGR